MLCTVDQEIYFQSTQGDQAPVSEIVGIVFLEAWQRVFIGVSDGSIYSLAETDNIARQCAAHNGDCLKHLRSIPGDPDRLLTITVNGGVNMWQVTDQNLVLMRSMSGYVSPIPPCVVTCSLASSDYLVDPVDASVSHFLVFAASEGAVKWWDLNNCSSEVIHGGGRGRITALAADAGGSRVAIGTAEGHIQVFNMSSLRFESTAQVEGSVTRLSFLAPGDETYRGRQSLAIVADKRETELQVYSYFMDENVKDQYDRLDFGLLVTEVAPLDASKLLVVLQDGQLEIVEGDQLCRTRIPSPHVGPICNALGRIGSNDNLLYIYRAYSPMVCYFTVLASISEPISPSAGNSGSTSREQEKLDLTLNDSDQVRSDTQDTLMRVPMDEDPLEANAMALTLTQATPSFLKRILTT
ncbi:hypothetical protein F5Y01DRAFT_300898 [Xylaria sp. FL0043]|nr:hypothetical protein F5Y01DRAFT_300898 [Xylaria sp. FL0043]